MWRLIWFFAGLGKAVGTTCAQGVKYRPYSSFSSARKEKALPLV